MKFVTGDETGLVKVVQVDKGACKRMGEQGRAFAVENVAWRADVPAGAQFVVARKGGVVETWNEEMQRSMALTGAPQANVGLHVLGKGTPSERLLACGEAGDVQMWTLADSTAEAVATFNVPSPVCRLRLDPAAEKAIAFGGKENDLTILDLETQEQLFKAKNVRHDFLDMRVPVWIRDLHFLNAGTAAGGSTDGFRVVTATEYHQVRMYDTRAQRRPVRDFSTGELPFTCMALSSDQDSVVVADTQGHLVRLDLGTGRIMAAYKGMAGSARRLECHATLPLLFAAGMDRYVRVYDMNTREVAHRYYLKQRLTALAVSTEGYATKQQHSAPRSGGKQAAQAAAEPAADDAEDVWRELKAREKRSARWASTTLPSAGQRGSAAGGAKARAEDSDGGSDDVDSDIGSLDGNVPEDDASPAAAEAAQSKDSEADDDSDSGGAGTRRHAKKPSARPAAAPSVQRPAPRKAAAKKPKKVPKPATQRAAAGATKGGKRAAPTAAAAGEQKRKRRQ